MLKTAILIAGTVVFSVFASPAPAPGGAISPGTAIPLARRSSLTGADGVFDKDKAVLATIDTINKHIQNRVNFQKYTGGSVKIRSPVPLPSDVDSKDRLLRREEKRQSEALTDESNNIEWAGTISVGTPKKGTAKQNFLIDFDTGSADLWIPSSSCLSLACRKKSKYNPTSSSTSSRKPETLYVEYGDDSSASGPVYSDTVTVAGVSATNQYFAAMTTLSLSFYTDPIDGIMGMGLLPISGLQQDPFVMNAKSEGAFGVGQFSFYLANTGSELYIGGTDSKKYTGAIEFNSINTTTGFWEPTNAQAKVGSTTVLTGLQTIVDSGTTLMYCPPAVVQQIYAKVPGAKVFDAEEGYYSYPCASPPQISFNYGGKDWTISAANLNLGLTKAKSKDCVAALAGVDIGFGAQTCILGDAFMKNFYSVFDLDQKAVGFATLA
ncbi:acid protease [Mycena alexandri]|uniref:Acid protease n=1 Tax=Mycena alexandri TaxID=1745969 RepID=A0AAD6X3R1_9AGAR|nr:acid protease [Mycena alexandri]